VPIPGSARSSAHQAPWNAIPYPPLLIIGSVVEWEEICAKARGELLEGRAFFSAPVYYRFLSGYSRAMLFNVVEAGNLPKGGIITDDLMNVQGRFVASDGTWVDGAAAAAQGGRRESLRQ
jgi:hypothetical protein